MTKSTTLGASPPGGGLHPKNVVRKLGKALGFYLLTPTTTAMRKAKLLSGRSRDLGMLTYAKGSLVVNNDNTINGSTVMKKRNTNTNIL